MTLNTEIVRTKDELLISVPANIFDDEEINDFLSFLKANYAIRRNEPNVEKVKADHENE